MNKSSAAATQFRKRGYAMKKAYPQAADKVNVEHNKAIVNAMDNGLQAIHFRGHGGRDIWRTGPSDLQKNQDLFTLDHLGQFQATRRLPVVLSLTCYTAPFDYLNADSLGEKLLRLPEGGAIALLAASWRNSLPPVLAGLCWRSSRNRGLPSARRSCAEKRSFGTPCWFRPTVFSAILLDQLQPRLSSPGWSWYTAPGSALSKV
jgi:hypothetical protein